MVLFLLSGCCSAKMWFFSLLALQFMAVSLRLIISRSNEIFSRYARLIFEDN